MTYRPRNCRPVRRRQVCQLGSVCRAPAMTDAEIDQLLCLLQWLSLAMTAISLAAAAAAAGFFL